MFCQTLRDSWVDISLLMQFFSVHFALMVIYFPLIVIATGFYCIQKLESIKGGKNAVLRQICCAFSAAIVDVINSSISLIINREVSKTY